MRHQKATSTITAVVVLLCLIAGAQNATAKRWTYRAAKTPHDTVAVVADTMPAKSLPTINLAAIDSALTLTAGPLTPSFLAPTVFSRYYFNDSIGIHAPRRANIPYASTTSWLSREQAHSGLMRGIIQTYMLEDPANCRYIADNLPQAPNYAPPVFDPKDHALPTKGVPGSGFIDGMSPPVDVKLTNWLHTYESSLQFSQSYISPNWYQGGTGNINGIGRVAYTVRLNPAFHPKLMFETSIDYKLSLNNAPDDTIHGYNISEDLLRITTKFGLKAFKKWYYSVNLLFKTQLLNSYKKNSNDMMASFLSPGELNVGVGMTYNLVNAKKTVTFDASMSPLSWNMKSCISQHINPATFGIEAGHKVVNKIGSSGEFKFKWKMAKNITYNSRFYVFTDYKYLQGDWENTLAFEINRFLSTQIFAHLRYDSSTNPPAEAKWRYWQVKEVFSIGFSYKFTNELKK